MTKQFDNFDSLRVAVGLLLALAGIGVIIFVWLNGFTDLVLAGFGVLLVLVGVVIAMASKDSDLADEIIAFFNVLR